MIIWLPTNTTLHGTDSRDHESLPIKTEYRQRSLSAAFSASQPRRQAVIPDTSLPLIPIQNVLSALTQSAFFLPLHPSATLVPTTQLAPPCPRWPPLIHLVLCIHFGFCMRSTADLGCTENKSELLKMAHVSRLLLPPGPHETIFDAYHATATHVLLRLPSVPPLS